MHKAVLLHGTDGTPDNHWFPWLQHELEQQGCEVFAPQLPNSHTPNRELYDNYLRNSGWDFHDNILLGHSSGATTILNLLSEDWFPKVRAVVLIAAFLNEKWVKKADWYDPGQFDNLFLESYDPELLKQKAEKFIFVHGGNDPFCDIEDARNLCEKVNGKFLTIENGYHLGERSGIKVLTGLMNELRSSL